MPVITEAGIKQRYHYNLSRIMLENWVGLLTDPFDSDQAVEKYPWLGSSPKMRRWVGSRQAQTPDEYGFEIRNQPYEATQDIPGNMIRRGRFSHVDRLIRGLAVRNVRHWGELVSALMKAGETSLAYDGVSYYGSHTIGDAPAQSNDLTYDSTSTTAPTVAEAAEAMGAAIDNITGRLDDRGEPMHEGVKQFVCMVPHNLRRTFASAAGAQLITNVGATGVETNPLRVSFEGFQLTIVGSPRLSNAQDGGAAWTTKFAMFCVDADNKPFIRQDEVAMSAQVKIKGAGSDYEFDHDHWQVGTQASRAVGFGSWETAALTTFV